MPHLSPSVVCTTVVGIGFSCKGEPVGKSSALHFRPESFRNTRFPGDIRVVPGGKGVSVNTALRVNSGAAKDTFTLITVGLPRVLEATDIARSDVNVHDTTYSNESQATTRRNPSLDLNSPSSTFQTTPRTICDQSHEPLSLKALSAIGTLISSSSAV